MNRSVSSLILFFGLLFFIDTLAAPSSASAYLDPGTGSMALQLIVAGILGALFTLKMYWRRTKSFIAGIFKRNNSDV